MTMLCSVLNRDRPLPNSYWATPQLLACEYPWEPKTSKPKLDALLKAGVRTFVDLTECGELSPYASQLLVRASLLNIDHSVRHHLYLAFSLLTHARVIHRKSNTIGSRSETG
jgi:hypothetical protein